MFRVVSVFTLLLLAVSFVQANPVSIPDTGLLIEPPTGWSQLTNPDTGFPRFISPDGMAVIDINPAKDGVGLNGKSLVESKAQATENVLQQNGIQLTGDKTEYKERDGGSYLFKTYHSNVQGQSYLFAMGFVYLGEHSILSNSSLPAGIANNYLAAVKKSLMSVSTPKAKVQTPKTKSKPAATGSSFAYGGVSSKKAKTSKASTQETKQKQVIKQKSVVTKPVKQTTTSSSKFKLVEDWNTGYSYVLPQAWLDSSQSSNKFHKGFRPAHMTSGHLSSFDRMRTYFKGNLEETYQYFLKNNMKKGKELNKQDVTIGGRPGRVVDVEYDYPTVVVKGRLVLVETEEFVYQLFMRGPSTYKGKPEPRTGNGYWENSVLPAMVEFQKSFKPMRSGVVPGITPQAGYVLVQSNNADLKFELPQGWFSHSQKVKDGKLNIGMTSGTNFGSDGVYMRFDSYTKKAGTQHADINAFADKKRMDIETHPKRLNRVISVKDLMLNGMKAKLIEVHSANTKPRHIRWMIFVETPTKVALFEMSGQENPANGRDRSFRELGVPTANHMMKTLSSTQKSKFGSAKTEGI